jgi:hypothetical protein
MADECHLKLAIGFSLRSKRKRKRSREKKSCCVSDKAPQDHGS